MKDEILAAYDRIAPLVRQTPLEHSAELGAFLKLEHLQHTGSFKFRGASNKIALLTRGAGGGGRGHGQQRQSRAGRGGRSAGARHCGGGVRLVARLAGQGAPH